MDLRVLDDAEREGFALRGWGLTMKLGIAGPILVSPFRSHLGSPLRPDHPPGQGGTSVWQLALTLLERGWRLVIFTLDKNVKDEVVLEGPMVKICIGPYRSAPRRRARDFFRAERAYLLEAMRREAPDLINAHWTYEYALAAIESGLPTIVTARDAPFNIIRYGPVLYRFMRLLMAIKVMRRTQHLTVNSLYLLKHMRTYFCYTRPITIIPNGFRRDIFALAKPEPHEPGDAICFATVLPGWGRRKNGKVALLAFRLVRERLPSARLLMFGSGHGPGGGAWAWARKKSLDEGVDFVGSIPHAELLQRLRDDVDVLVHPALEESFGNALVEAMVIGIPVIGGKDSGAVPHTLEDGKAGLLVDVRSPEEVAAAMLRLAQTSGLYLKFARAGRDSALRRFHMEKVVTQYEHLYLESQQAPARPS